MYYHVEGTSIVIKLIYKITQNVFLPFFQLHFCFESKETFSLLLLMLQAIKRQHCVKIWTREWIGNHLNTSTTLFNSSEVLLLVLFLLEFKCILIIVHINILYLWICVTKVAHSFLEQSSNWFFPNFKVFQSFFYLL